MFVIIAPGKLLWGLWNLAASSGTTATNRMWLLTVRGMSLAFMEASNSQVLV
jgi:hypothetical protein